MHAIIYRFYAEGALKLIRLLAFVWISLPQFFFHVLFVFLFSGKSLN